MNTERERRCPSVILTPLAETTCAAACARRSPMTSLAEQISQWESEERAYLVHQMRTRARQVHSQDPACSTEKDKAGASGTLSGASAPSVAQSVSPERSSPLRRRAMLGLADASGGRMLLPASPRTPTSASPRRSLAEQGKAHSLRRRRMWQAEQQAKQDHAAVRPRQCTTQREYFGDFAAAAARPAGPQPHAMPEDRAVCAALELAYADGEVFFTHGGAVLHRSPSSKPSSPQQPKAHWSTTRGSGLRVPYRSPPPPQPPPTAPAQDRPWR